VTHHSLVVFRWLGTFDEDTHSILLKGTGDSGVALCAFSRLWCIVEPMGIDLMSTKPL